MLPQDQTDRPCQAAHPSAWGPQRDQDQGEPKAAPTSNDVRRASRAVGLGGLDHRREHGRVVGRAGHLGRHDTWSSEIAA